MLSSNKNIFRCKDIINSDICLKHDKNLINHTQTLLTLYKLFTQNSSFADKSYQSHQNIGGHNVFGKCTVCLGSGIHPCKRCQNSKRCADCAGKGIQQHVSFDEARNPHYYDQQCFTCRGSAICTKCRGLNITCKGCKGSRKSINREEISKAITKEKATISKLLLDIRNQIKEFSDSLNFVP